MAERSGFFTAIQNADGVYDRQYKSEDYCDNLAAIISNGVVRGDLNELQVTASGMAVSVDTGRGWINGHWYINDSMFSFDPVIAPTGSPRYDRVFLTFDNSIEQRKVYLQYRQGTPSQNPIRPTAIRTGNIYELVLSDIYVAANATSVIVEDQRSNSELCGWVYSTAGDDSFFTSLDNQFDTWFEEKKDDLSSVTTEIEYKQVSVISSESSQVQITIPQYDSTINQKLTVYVNGILQNNPDNYSVSGSTITFESSLIAGTEVTIIITVSKDGTGISSSVDDITELQGKVAALEEGLIESEYTYICNGSTDNVEISNIVNTFLGGTEDSAQLTIHIYGTFGATSPSGGSGTNVSPYTWFTAGDSGDRRVVLDFESCSKITLPNAESGKYYIVFSGRKTYIRNCNLFARGTGSYIYMFDRGGNSISNAENCRFEINALSGYIARGGTFSNCYVRLTTNGDNAYMFPVLSAGLLRLFGGEYGSVTTASGFQSSVIFVAATQSDAAVITYAINCPTLTLSSGAKQSYAIYCLGGKCSFYNTITTLPISAEGQNIQGTIAVDKEGMM